MMKRCFAVALLFFCMVDFTYAATGGEVMDRPTVAIKSLEKWQGERKDEMARTDPEFAAITNNLLYGEILDKGSLTDAQKSLVILASLVASQGWDEFPEAVKSGLRVGATPLEIRETLYQCAPYVGAPRVKKALMLANAEFEAANVKLPLENAATVTEATRLADGLAVQKSIFGSAIDDMRKNAPDNQKDIVANYLSAWCFGDFYTRKVLDLKNRELITFSAIVSLGGCDPQAQAHAQGNLAVGNTADNLIDALAVMLPYIGFPRTLNGLARVNAVLPKAEK